MVKTIRKAIAILLAATAVMLLVLPELVVNADYTKGDFVIDGGTLVSYTGTESDITIPLGITTIGKDAFSGNNTLTKVYIPDEVTSIDYAAFENCKNLQKVQIGDGVKTIGASAFSGCMSLKDVNIPRYTEDIGSGAFAACPNLTTVDISSKNRHYVCLDGVIYTRDGDKMVQYLAGRPYSTYDIPEPVTEIEEFGFYGANMLTNVSVIKGVEEIPDYAFLNCTALTNVELPGTIKAIRKGAFGGCSNLTKLKVPTTCGLIDPEAFTSLEGVRGSVVNETNGEVLSESNEDSNTDNTASEIVGNVTETIENAVSGAIENAQEAIDSVTGDELGSTTIVGGEAVLLLNPASMKVYGFDMNEAQREDSIADSGNTSSSGEDIRSYSGQEYDVVDGILGHTTNNGADVSLPSGINKIGNRVFYNNKNLSSVSIPDSVFEIGDFAFARSNLTSVDIPASVDRIGYAAFYNCDKLESINVPGSVKEIELGALENTAFINNWRSVEDGNNFLVLGDGILVAYKGHGSSVAIPESVKTIGPGVFEGNTRIKSVIIPGNCKKICEDAFNGCSGISSVILPDYIETIEDRAFKDTNLSFVQIPSGVKEIGLGAFDTVNVNGGMDAVMFKGSFLPNVSYKPTATRLSATNLRTNAFNGTDIAFVPSGVNMSSGTMFDPNSYGFRGQVYSSGQMGPNGEQYVQLRTCTKEPDATGNISVDSELKIGDKNYYLSGVSDNAFDAYKSPSWCENSPKSISLKGNNSSALDNLLADVNASIGTGSNSGPGIYRDAININIPDGSMNKLYCDAVIPNSSEQFNLTINSNPSLRTDFEKAFDNRFGTHSGVLMDTFDIDMTDKLGTVPIKKMATGKLNITLPIPSEFNEAENVSLATLDDNGLFEEVSGTIAEKGDGTKTISFVASHLSPFAIFTADSVLSQNVDGEVLTTETVSVTNEETLASGMNNVLEGSVIFGTLQKEVVPGIPARVIIAIIMILAAVVLFLYKKPRVRNKGQAK